MGYISCRRAIGRSGILAGKIIFLTQCARLSYSFISNHHISKNARPFKNRRSQKKYFEQLLRFLPTSQTSRVHPYLEISTLSLDQPVHNLIPSSHRITVTEMYNHLAVEGQGTRFACSRCSVILDEKYKTERW